MRIAAIALLAVVLPGCAAAPQRQKAPLQFPLANAGFEEAPPPGECPRAWSCTVHGDPTAFRFFTAPGAPAGGARSLCMEPVKPQPWAYVTQGRFDARLRGKRVRLRLDVKLTDVSGRGAGAAVRAHDGHGSTVLARERLLTGTHDWQTLSLDVEVPAEAVEVDVGGILIGRGRLCIDNARVEVLP